MKNKNQGPVGFIGVGMNVCQFPYVVLRYFIADSIRYNAQ